MVHLLTTNAHHASYSADKSTLICINTLVACTKQMKYNLESIPSIHGIAIKSMQKGDIGPALTRLALFSDTQAPDDYIIMAKHQMSNLLSDWVFPRILQEFSTSVVPKDFSLYAVYVEMHSEQSKNKLLINEDTGFKIKCVPKTGMKFKPDDKVMIGDVEGLVSIEKEDKDPNAATIMLAYSRGGWYGSFDYTYNRGHTQQKINRAINFFSAATESLKKTNFQAFYESLWSCSELLAESVLLLNMPIELKTSHKGIQKRFEGFCKNYNYNYIENYKQISEIRESARYGPPHPWSPKWEKEAPRLLQSTREFLGVVLTFLQERDVILSRQSDMEIRSLNLGV